MIDDNSFQSLKIDLNIELDGFDNNVDLGAGDWLTFGFIPFNVEVFFSLDNNSKNKIKALQGLQIQSKHSKIYLWSVGTSVEAMEIMHWGGDNLKMIMPPRSDFESLNGYGALALEQLDKIINPYYLPIVSVATNATTTISTIFLKTLTCDKISIKTSCGIASSSYAQSVTVSVDGVPISKISTYANSTYGYQGSENNDNFILYGVRGITIEIKSAIGSAFISEYTLKT